MKAMLLAAGRGERMRPLTDRCPKPLLEVGGERLIERHVRRLYAAGVREFVVNLHHLGEQVEAALRSLVLPGSNFAWSREPAALETGGGIRHALPLLGEAPFIVVSTDVYTDFDFSDLPTGLSAGIVGHLVMVPNRAHHETGDFQLEDGRLQRADGGDTLTYAGISIFRGEPFAAVNETAFPMRVVMDAAIDAGALRGQRYEGTWSDIGTPDRLAALAAELAGED